ncbi:hypothetical protein ACFFX0_27505 [Citricoccus parietis]|uniref:Uncharacterized protein n=1 Tax=Citricoccus parietis TaxID=592307 RepID=A0ABV5G707_9MICC
MPLGALAGQDHRPRRRRRDRAGGGRAGRQVLGVEVRLHHGLTVMVLLPGGPRRARRRPGRGRWRSRDGCRDGCHARSRRGHDRVSVIRILRVGRDPAGGIGTGLRVVVRVIVR